ncbi:MAG: 5-(carboxyamino)imidazole ribonucleotide synthase [Ignavibacteria bacterium]|nr:5-(carboxyamino)imidazole ribonucleotide synthase [Ignavibacteria bacterium]
MLKSKKHKKTFTVGILGGGQLAKMMALDVYRLGLEVAIIENGSNSPAGDMTKLEFTEGWHNKRNLDDFIKVSDIITLENEFIEPEILEYISNFVDVFPSAKTMRLVQDKFNQKTVFSENHIPVPDFASIDTIEEAYQFGERFGYPFLIKTRTLGYDGYGNYTVKNTDDISTAFAKFTSNGKQRKLMAERFINFKRELAVMVARSLSGEIAVYPVVETIQENHICKVVLAPADISEEQQSTAQKIAIKCVESIDGVGVFGIEMFEDSNGKILVNEIAPRPHNSGHYTIEACRTSQYENAIRAITGLPLGSTEMITPAACMVNLLGERDGIGIPTDISKVLSYGNIKLHLYNKKTSRKGRKMGHVTALRKTTKEAYDIAMSAAQSIIW